MRSDLLVGIVISRTVLAVLLASCSGASEPIEIRTVTPSNIGARTADFKIYISGTGFTLESRVLLGALELGPVGHAPTVLFVQVPGGTAGTTVPGTVSVSVINPDGTRSNELPLVVSEARAPVLTKVLSERCAEDDPLYLTLVGDNFTIDMTLEINGEPASIAERSRSSLSFFAPRRDSTFKITVPPPGGGATSIGYAPPFLGCD